VPNSEDPRYAKALRHPLRARILAILQETEATPTQLAKWLEASVGTAAYHVRTLAALGLIELVGETRVRGAVAHHYRALAEPERVAEEELGRSAADVRTASAVPAASGATLSTLDPKVCPVAAAGKFDDERALATRASLRLDTAGWQQLSQACSQLLGRAERIARESTERLAQNPQHSEHSVGMVLFVFEATAESDEAIS